MRYTATLLIASALLCPLAARAQTPTPQPTQQPDNLTTRLNEDPRFKRLSPEEQAWTRNIVERLDKAIANKDLAAIEQIKREAEQHQQALGNKAVTATTPAPLPAVPRKLEDNPEFKKLSPDEQEQVRNLYNAFRDAENNPSATIPPKPTAPAIVPIPKTPPPQTGCVAAPPKKPGVLDKLKQHAQRTLAIQAAKADARIAKQSGGNVDAGAQDATTTAMNQPKPCPPAPATVPKPPQQ
jgi:hypothetical protein